MTLTASGTGLATLTSDGQVLDTWFPAPALSEVASLVEGLERLVGAHQARSPVPHCTIRIIGADNRERRMGTSTLILRSRRDDRRPHQGMTEHVPSSPQLNGSRPLCLLKSRPDLRVGEAESGTAGFDIGDGVAVIECGQQHERFGWASHAANACQEG